MRQLAANSGHRARVRRKASPSPAEVAVSLLQLVVPANERRVVVGSEPRITRLKAVEETLHGVPNGIVAIDVSARNVGGVEVAKQRVQSVDHSVGRGVAALARAADVACVKASIERLEGSEVSTDHLPVMRFSGRLRMTLRREEGEVAANRAETREHGQENDDRQRDRESSRHEVAIGLRVG